MRHVVSAISSSIAETALLERAMSESGVGVAMPSAPDFLEFSVESRRVLVAAAKLSCSGLLLRGDDVARAGLGRLKNRKAGSVGYESAITFLDCNREHGVRKGLRLYFCNISHRH